MLLAVYQPEYNPLDSALDEIENGEQIDIVVLPPDDTNGTDTEQSEEDNLEEFSTLSETARRIEIHRRGYFYRYRGTTRP